MALADLKKMEDAVWKVIEHSTGQLRTKTSNRKTHIIECGTKMLREECDKQMAAREGYRTKELFKKGLKKRFGNDTPFNDIMGKFTEHVAPFVGTMYRDLQREMNKEGSLYVIDFVQGSTKDHWIVEIYKKGKKSGRGDVFQGFKADFKADAQRPLVEAINDWAMTKGGGGQSRNARGQYTSGTTGGGSGRTYSRRGQQFTEGDEGGFTAKELNKKIGLKSGDKKKEASRTIRTKGTQGLSTETWIDQEGKTQISDSNDPFVDLGHEDDSSVAGLRKVMLNEFLDNWKGSDGAGAGAMVKNHLKEQINLNIDSNASYAGEITKSVKSSFEASFLNKQTMTKKEVENLNKEFTKAVNKAAGDIYAKAGGSSAKMGTAAWLEMESSDSFATMVEKKTIESLVKPLRKKKGVRVKTRLKTKKQKNSKTKLKGATKKPKRTVSKGTYIAAKVAKVLQKTRSKTKSKASPGHAPLFLLGIFNKELPETVRANMGAPALTNVTGRFASSVRATDMIMTPKGLPSYGYTYQRDPYGTFEQDTNYDPRKLIDRSMREVAAEYAIGRFYTRRV